MVEEKVLADNANETIMVKWDGTRFAIAHLYKNPDGTVSPTAIVLNSKEMTDLIEFAVGRKL